MTIKRPREEDPHNNDNNNNKNKYKKSNKDDDENDDDDESENDKNIRELIDKLFSLPDQTIVINQGDNDEQEEEEQEEEDKCNNPLCNHKTYEEDASEPEISNIAEIKDIDDLIRLGKTYHCKKNTVYYGLDLKILCNLILPLSELRDMIGLKDIKVHIVDQILFFMRGYNKKDKCNECTECAFNLPCTNNVPDMFHTAITGPPGVGKTKFGKILCKIYKECKLLSKGHFRLVLATDLISKWIGDTRIKTQKIIEDCQGGTMFIDEAYGLGQKEGPNTMSKECIDTINQNLSEKRDWLCIIAGYKDVLNECFFAMNEGLSRRFPFRYDINGYNAEELMQIFLLKLRQESWETDFMVNNDDDDNTRIEKEKKRDELLKYFKVHEKNFPNYGGDIETLLLNCKIIHCKKIALNKSTKDDYNDKILNLDDIISGLNMFNSFREEKNNNPPPTMYI